MAEPGNFAVSDERDEKVWFRASRMSGRGEAKGEATGEGRAILLIGSYRQRLVSRWTSCRRKRSDEVRVQRGETAKAELGARQSGRPL